ncbi:MAG: hypothetical protein ABIH47_06665 [Candidatus Omnitrophota bacterium]
MTTEYNPIKEISKILGMDATNVVHQLAAEKSLNIPFLEKNILKESNALSNGMVESAQQRMTRWRNNIQRMRERRKKFAQVAHQKRTDPELAKEAIARTKIAFLQKEEARKEKRDRRLRDIKINDKDKVEERMHEQIQKRRAEIGQRTAQYAKRLEAEKAQEPSPQEAYERLRTLKKNAVDKMTERAEEKERLFAHKQVTRQQAQETLAERLAEKTEERTQMFSTKDRSEIHAKREERMHDHREAQKIVRDAIIERRDEQRYTLAELVEYGDKIVEENVEKRVDHFKQLKQRLLTLADRAHIKREDMENALAEFVAEMRKKTDAYLKELDDPATDGPLRAQLELFQEFRARFNDILSEAGERRRNPQALVDMIERYGRARTGNRPAQFGDPRSRVLTDLANYLTQKHRLIFATMAHVQERNVYHHLLMGLPPIIRKKIHRIFHRVILSLWDINATSLNNPFFSVAHRKRNIASLTHWFVERIVSLRVIRSLFMRLVEKNYDYLKSIPFGLQKENTQEINLLLRQENLKSLLSGMLVDKTLQAETVLSTQDFNKAKTGFSVFLYSLKTQNTHDRESENSPSKPASYITRLIHLLKDTKTASRQEEKNRTSDEIFNLLETAPLPFDTLRKEIDTGLHRDGVISPEKVFAGPTAQELEEERLEKEAELHKAVLRKKKQDTTLTRRKEFLKAIEEQNLTAQERANNEQNLIDFFF